MRSPRFLIQAIAMNLVALTRRAVVIRRSLRRYDTPQSQSELHGILCALAIAKNSYRWLPDEQRIAVVAEARDLMARHAKAAAFKAA